MDVLWGLWLCFGNFKFRFPDGKVSNHSVCRHESLINLSVLRAILRSFDQKVSCTRVLLALILGDGRAREHGITFTSCTATRGRDNIFSIARPAKRLTLSYIVLYGIGTLMRSSVTCNTVLLHGRVSFRFFFFILLLFTRISGHRVIVLLFICFACEQWWCNKK